MKQNLDSTVSKIESERELRRYEADFESRIRFIKREHLKTVRKMRMDHQTEFDSILNNHLASIRDHFIGCNRKVEEIVEESCRNFVTEIQDSLRDHSATVSRMIDEYNSQVSMIYEEIKEMKTTLESLKEKLSINKREYERAHNQRISNEEPIKHKLNQIQKYKSRIAWVTDHVDPYIEEEKKRNKYLKSRLGDEKFKHEILIQHVCILSLAFFFAINHSSSNVRLCSC